MGGRSNLEGDDLQPEKLFLSSMLLFRASITAKMLKGRWKRQGLGILARLLRYEMNMTILGELCSGSSSVFLMSSLIWPQFIWRQFLGSKRCPTSKISEHLEYNIVILRVLQSFNQLGAH